MVRRRLDTEMVRRGLAGTVSEAGLVIRAGRVRVAGRPAASSGSLVASGEAIRVADPARRFASRGGDKLEAALGRFDVTVEGRDALDAGASTGGFTDCLLRRGAHHVVAVDVGYGLLDWRLRQDPRVTVMERTNVRSLDPSALPFRPELMVADLSFISLGLALPALAACGTDAADLVLLVKPQFEADRGEVRRGGVVDDPAVWERAVRGVVKAAGDVGFEPRATMASPMLGPAGNVEFFLHASRPPAPPSDVAAGASFERAVRAALAEAGALRGGAGA
jgi:23S rRNA (cytidine1920-2'-O)/16S rRNA (cytidine1409-2'-O)-methyltransferase